MSAPVAALRAVSLRDSLAKTVRLLTKSGIDVHFRGHQPHVVAKGNKAVRLVLPEINDDAPAELLEAIQGYLDHEVGHIFYTPFERAAKFARGDGKVNALVNIVEDIRLEKLLPRELPGTKENLDRMYEKFLPTMCAPPLREAVASSCPTTRFCGVLVVAMRALAGQKPFQAFMDQEKLWPHFMPLMSKMPTLSRRLREMEKFEDVEAIVRDIEEALKPPPAPPAPSSPTPQPKPKAPEPGDDSFDDGDQGEDQPGDDGTDDAEGDDSFRNGEDEDGDEGGSTSTEDGDTEDGDTEDGDTEDGDTEDGDTEDGDTEDGDKGESNSPGKNGKSNLTITQALKMLEPSQRNALFMYKKRKLSVEQIASETNKSEDDVVETLRAARKRLGEIMAGAR